MMTTNLNLLFRTIGTVVLSACLLASAHAQETVCARVKLEIKQELTLERQAFDAEMKIFNSTETDVIENVSVVVRVTDENGTPVTVTDDPNNLSAKFFVRLSHKENIANVDGTGVVGAKSTAVINWLLIPAAGSAGLQVVGKKYLVGATLKYKFGAEDTVLEVSPDVITVKPLPLITLDYFLTRDVVADDALTLPIEPAEPFTLGVRVKNNGFATAKNLKIDSAQPKIIENNQGLLINFALTGSYIDDAPAANSLLINFGDVAGKTSKMGRWIMETTLAGKFTEFTARFTHADELGGALTSLLEATNAHFLLRDVKVDLPGRDQVRDFLAQDGDVVRVYESDAGDTIVTDRSAVATFSAAAGSSNYRLSFPPTDGFVFVRLPDPNAGARALGAIMRSDAKAIAPENAWLSKTRNEQTKKWEYFINFFDVNSTGLYDSQFTAPPVTVQPPVLQAISDKTVEEGNSVSFLVEASSPNGKPVTISAAPMPAGANLVAPAIAPLEGSPTRVYFSWTPPPGSAGKYPITFSASDGTLSAQRLATITVVTPILPAGPAAPALVTPLAGATFIAATTPLQVQTSAPAAGAPTQVQFELYMDEGFTELVASKLMAAPLPVTSPMGNVSLAPTAWTLPLTLTADTRYWWRARTFDGALYSVWVNGRFNVEMTSPAPNMFNQTAPSNDGRVDSFTPLLSWTNSSVRYEDPISYSVTVYSDAALTTAVATATGLAESASGTTSWRVQPALTSPARYYWRVIAHRSPAIENVVPGVAPVSAKTGATLRSFTVDLSNTAPTAPVLVGPTGGAANSAPAATLYIGQSADAQGDALTYVFELDRVKTFDSAARRTSGQVSASAGNVSWTTPVLVENERYWWRAKAQDGKAESDWVVGEFIQSTVNDAPPAPGIRNPGNGAWIGLLQPSLEAIAVRDPEGDAVRYEFQVYNDAALGAKAAEGSSANAALLVPLELSRKGWYWWRARAVDASNAAGPWSAVSSMYVSGGGADAPAIALTSPSVATVPVTVNGVTTRKLATIRWEGIDPNRQPTLALYYGSSKSGFTGTQIVQGLQQDAGAISGSYTWDVSALAPGVYHVYVVAADNRGTARAYAPGPVVIPNPVQTGSLVSAVPGKSVEGNPTTVAMSWNGSSAKPIIMPLSGTGRYINAPPRLAKASGSRMMALHFPFQCSTQVASFPLQVGPLMTEDLNFAGRAATSGTAVIHYTASNTGDETLRVCDLRVLSQTPVDATQSDFVVAARLSNLSAAMLGARAVPVANEVNVTATGTLDFGAIGAGETGLPEGVVTVRAPNSYGQSSIMSKGLKWTVTVTR